jgi:hypothetical protein
LKNVAPSSSNIYFAGSAYAIKRRRAAMLVLKRVELLKRIVLANIKLIGNGDIKLDLKYL